MGDVMSMPNIAVSLSEWGIIQHILEQHVPQHAVWAFGSRAMGTAKPYSDLDLAIIADKPLGLDISAAMAEAFSESDLPYKVDLVDWATTSEPFQEIIKRNKVVIREQPV